MHFWLKATTVLPESRMMMLRRFPKIKTHSNYRFKYFTAILKKTDHTHNSIVLSICTYVILLINENDIICHLTRSLQFLK